MPKSKTRRKNTNRKSVRGGSPRQPALMTADPRTWVSDNRPMVPYGTKPLPGHHIVYQAPSTKGMRANETRLHTVPGSGDVWVFPKAPTARLLQADSNARAAFEAADYATELALGSKTELIQSLNPRTKELLSACSKENAGPEGILAELYCHGMFNYRTSSNESVQEWLDNLYLGTWDDPSWAAAAFLYDLETEVSDTRRKAGYERLKEMLVVVEMPLWNGRTAVSLEQRCENGDRFIASQWVAHSVIPTVFGV